MTTRRISVTALAVLLFAAAYTLPVVTCRLPSDTWDDSEFPQVKSRVESVVSRLRGLHYQVGKIVGHDKIPSYTLVAQHGKIDMRKAVLGSWRFGSSETGTWAFGVPCLLGMPFVMYDHEKETAQITPQTIDQFLSWASRAEIDPDKHGYRDPGDGQQPPQRR